MNLSISVLVTIFHTVHINSGHQHAKNLTNTEIRSLKSALVVIPILRNRHQHNHKLNLNLRSRFCCSSNRTWNNALCSPNSKLFQRFYFQSKADYSWNQLGKNFNDNINIYNSYCYIASHPRSTQSDIY